MVHFTQWKTSLYMMCRAKEIFRTCVSDCPYHLHGKGQTITPKHFVKSKSSVVLVQKLLNWIMIVEVIAHYSLCGPSCPTSQRSEIGNNRQPSEDQFPFFGSKFQALSMKDIYLLGASQNSRFILSRALPKKQVASSNQSW